MRKCVLTNEFDDLNAPAQTYHSAQANERNQIW